MDDNQLLRYSRHILLPEIGIDGQERIAAGHALIVGLGGLGSPVALYLASAGVGILTLCDNDAVDLTNLQRQIAHDTTTIGMPKVESARQRIAAINPGIDVRMRMTRVGESDLCELVRTADVALDCSDNFATRHAINRACVAAGTPLVSGAALRFDGQLAVFDTRRAASPCYHCIFGEGEEIEETRCAVMGVFAPLVGVMGAMQAAEALKLLAGCGTPVLGKLQLYDALDGEWRAVRVRRDPHCPVCAERPPSPAASDGERVPATDTSPATSAVARPTAPTASA
ncbi:MAG: molybdopterin-synthase adenylyltransferase MoeB [Betaproteobacteria bacterium]